MDVKYINPFISSLNNAAEMMIGIKPVRGKPFVKNNQLTTGDITGIIGFAEKNITGSVALSFPAESAYMVFEKMTGEQVSSINRDVQDSIGELANIVAGGAKTSLAEEGLSFHISIPSVVVGHEHAISHKSDTSVVVIPFTLDGLEFVMEVSMKISK